MSAPRGTEDYLPDEQELRRKVIDIVRASYEKYGFREMSTPAFEDFPTLTKKAGEEIKKEIYYFEDKSERPLGLRFDLTVSLARIMAEKRDLSKPFKRYCIDRVWRYDRPGKGRKREFWQADVDIVGSDSKKADVECLAALLDALKSLGFTNLSVRVNSRKSLINFAESIGLKSGKEQQDAFTAMDKLDKIGRDGVEKELKDRGIKKKQRDKILKYLQEGWDKEEEGCEEIQSFREEAKNYGIEDKIIPDQSLVRGLNYYSGLIVEIMSLGDEDIGSIAAGGRYDGLVKLYGGEDLSAVGMSIGIDRIVEIIKERDLLEIETNRTFVVAVNDEVRDHVFNLVEKLRDVGIPSDYDISDRGLSKQLRHADNTGFRYAVIIGEKELERGKYTLKDLKLGSEREAEEKELFEIIKS